MNPEYEKVKILHIKEVSQKLFEELSGKNFGPEANMFHTFRSCWRDELELCWVFLKRDRKTKDVAAWALLWAYDYAPYEFKAYFWTCPEHRRKGLGTEIFRAAEKHSLDHGTMFKYYPWDPNSKSFFSSVDKSVKPRYIPFKKLGKMFDRYLKGLLPRK